MALPVTFTVDLEDHRPDASAPVRYPALCRAILEFLSARNVRGTFFVVGEVAAASPSLIREIADAGHEIGLHGWRHIQLTHLDAATARTETRRGRALLEDLSGTPVVGYRAPTYSLVPTTMWMTELLADEGFTYSSSVVAARNPLWGWPGAPSEPFVWPSGLVEFPAPLAGPASAAVPYLGGTYLRLLPRVAVRALRWWESGADGGRNPRGRAGRLPWVYVHCYDLDPDERYWRVPEAGALSPLLWVGRRRLWAKLDDVLAGGAAPPLRERIAEAVTGGTFRPVPEEVPA